MRNIDLITVASFDIAPDAWIYRNRLKCEGFSPVITDEHAVTMIWLYSNAKSGIKVQIPVGEIQKFQEFESRTREYAFPEFDDRNENALTTCPNCESIEIFTTMWPKRLIYLTILIFGFPLPLMAREMQCRDCGFSAPPV